MARELGYDHVWQAAQLDAFVELARGYSISGRGSRRMD